MASDIKLRQTVGGTVGGAKPELTLTFAAPTAANSLIYVAITPTLRSGQGSVPPVTVTSSPATTFTKITDKAVNWLAGSWWYRQASPSLTSVTVRVSNHNTFQVQVQEWTGVALTNALDRFVVAGVAFDDDPDSGTTATTQLADELILATVSSRYASTGQSGFTGGFTKLSDTTSSSSNPDQERSRMTTHARIVTATGTHRITADLGTGRDWVAMVATFRAGTTGPVSFAADTQAVTTSSEADLTVFGPLVADTAAVTITSQAWIAPFDYQYLLGPEQLRIGAGTPYDVREIVGLEGWEMRTSDAEQARDDGALRGVDLQSARQVLVELDIGGSETEVEELLDALWRALVPRRDTDWPLVWRHPGRPLRQLWCRPVNLIRGLDYRRTLLADQRFVLRAADPRLYGLDERTVTVPVTAGYDATATATNDGNGYAYPTIEALNPTSGAAVNRVEVVNLTTGDGFDVATQLPAGSLLAGDMAAAATGAPRPVVTLDGQSKYGAWVFPRQPLRLAPGDNELYCRTTPDLSAVTARLIWRDTWSG